MKKTLMTAALLFSALAYAGAPPAARPEAAAARAAQASAQPGAQPGADGRDDRREEREKRVRMMMVVGLAEALNLSEAEALRMGDKVKGLEERRRPVREQMMEGMKTLKAASDGDPAALPNVDNAVQRVLDGRVQMAQLDKEAFATLSKDLPPQKRAQLAVFLARFHQKAAGMGGGKGRWGGRGARHELP